MVWNGDAWAALSPLQARVMRCLLEREREVVQARDLVAAAWPEGDGEDRADVNTPIKVLRRKSAPIGIMIHTVASRGYLVEVTEAATRQEVANSTP